MNNETRKQLREVFGKFVAMTFLLNGIKTPTVEEMVVLGKELCLKYNWPEDLGKEACLLALMSMQAVSAGQATVKSNNVN